MRILIVSPFFPPSATVAVVRVASLARQLAREGHELTVIRNNYNEKDYQLSSSNLDLLNLKTYKVEVDQSTRFFEASKRYKRIFRNVMDENKFDCVFITAGPYYTIPLCRIAKKEYNTKCVIDYRDLWIFDMRNKVNFFNPISLAKKLIYFPIERRNIKCADLVVTVTDDWKQILKRVYREDKFEVVANGYDDEQLNELSYLIDYPYHNNFVITAFGKLSYYSMEYGVKFFNAMKKLCKIYPDLLVLHIGLPEEETEEAIRISGFDKEKYVNTGFVNYNDGIQLLKNSNVNVIIEVRKGAMGTKFYDYVFVNKPIVYFGKKNTQLSHLVTEFENGFSCYTEDEVVKAISKMRKKSIYSLTNNSNTKEYSRSKQNREYIKIIKKMVR